MFVSHEELVSHWQKRAVHEDLVCKKWKTNFPSHFWNHIKRYPGMIFKINAVFDSWEFKIFRYFCAAPSKYIQNTGAQVDWLDLLKFCTDTSFAEYKNSFQTKYVIWQLWWSWQPIFETDSLAKDSRTTSQSLWTYIITDNEIQITL